MKELLQQYTQYNVWANKKIADILMKLDDAVADQAIISSFPTLRATVYHTWSAEFIWLQRLQLAENPVWAEAAFAGTLQEACGEWLKASAALADFTGRQYDDAALLHVLQYYDRKKVSHKSPVFQVLLHVCNHSTYHRGQLVTMLRQAGIKELPQTDFIAYANKK